MQVPAAAYMQLTLHPENKLFTPSKKPQTSLQSLHKAKHIWIY